TALEQPRVTSEPHACPGETKEKQEVSHKPPIPKNQESPACHQPLATSFVPFVAHFVGRQPDSFKFLFYQPTCSNSYSPFYTVQKPTCGYRYHRDTDHTRKVMDVSSVNIVKWSPTMGRRP
uniref:Uncharacterized protein n=1 Tax=Calidris pygmaea TaxID=425635 RepID=A0A8C3KU92_9CHAR